MLGKFKPNRQRAASMVACIIIILVIVVAGVAIYQIIKFCNKFLGPGGPPPPNRTNQVQVFVSGLTEDTPFSVIKAVSGEIRRAERTGSLCNGFSTKIPVPKELPAGVTFYLQRSTNLVDWEDLFQVFEEDGSAGGCDPNPPQDRAFYRLRAQLPSNK